jgi:hypothetical protein
MIGESILVCPAGWLGVLDAGRGFMPTVISKRLRCSADLRWSKLQQTREPNLLCPNGSEGTGHLDAI